MKTNNQALAINKKLIIHFDVDSVIRIPSANDKDIFVIALFIKVYDLCS
jgi:hypothetical protein